MSTKLAADFEKALLLAGYAPNTARSAKAAASENAAGRDWSRRLFAQWEAGTLETRRSPQPRLAIRLISAGLSPVDAHNHAKGYLAWVAGNKSKKTRTLAIRRVQKILAQLGPFPGIDPQELFRRMKDLGLTSRQTGELLGVSKTTIQNWLAGKPIAPSWACERLAAAGEDIEL